MQIPFTLTPSVRKQIFLLQYYFGYGRFITITRLFVGPLLLLVGLISITSESKFSIIYGGGCIFYSLYYIAKPWLTVLFYPKRFEVTKFMVEITDTDFMIADSMGKSQIALDSFQWIGQKGQFIILQLDQVQSIYLPIRQLSAEQKQYLQQALTL